MPLFGVAVPCALKSVPWHAGAGPPPSPPPTPSTFATALGHAAEPQLCSGALPARWCGIQATRPQGDTEAQPHRHQSGLFATRPGTGQRKHGLRIAAARQAPSGRQVRSGSTPHIDARFTVAYKPITTSPCSAAAEHPFLRLFGSRMRGSSAEQSQRPGFGWSSFDLPRAALCVAGSRDRSLRIRARRRRSARVSTAPFFCCRARSGCRSRCTRIRACALCYRLAAAR